MSYWNSNGTYQAQYEELIKLVPREGEIKKGMCKHVFSLERFRKACNSYYDVFNNGGGNRDASTARHRQNRHSLKSHEQNCKALRLR